MNMRKHIFLNTMINIFHNVADQFIYIQTAKFHLSFVFRILTVSSVYSKFKSLRWRTLCKFHIRFKLTCVLYIYMILRPVPVAAQSEAWVFGRLLAWVVGSNPTGNMDVCLLCVLRVVR
jgi:hypothetical protein